jgi:hypothetical protein
MTQRRPPCAGLYEPTREAAMAACPLPPETVYDRAMRRARKLCLRLGGDPTDEE